MRCVYRPFTGSLPLGSGRCPFPVSSAFILLTYLPTSVRTAGLPFKRLYRAGQSTRGDSAPISENASRFQRSRPPAHPLEADEIHPHSTGSCVSGRG